MTRIAVLVASHNRRALTLECLDRLAGQVLPPGVVVRVVLVDDGSTDGTSQAVAERHPDVHVIAGDGSLFWAGGMRTAARSVPSDEVDHYLLLNDDTRLHPSAIAGLLGASASCPDGAIVVGATADPSSGVLTYGGWRCREGRNRLRMERVPIASTATSCDTFNGNCVLVPSGTFRALGGLGGAFTHGMADIDLGLRATDAGYRVVVAPGVVGTCNANTGRGLWTDEALSTEDRWRRLLGPKGLPPAEWRVLTSRHAGPLWPLYWANPYVKFWLRALAAHVREGFRVRSLPRSRT